MKKFKDIDRYNDDFYLTFDSGKKMYANHTATEIAYDRDWSISWFDIFKKGVGADVAISSILDTRATATANFGLFIYSSFNVGTQENFISIEFRTTVLETFTINLGIILDTFHISNFVFTFNSSSRTLNVYKNTILIGTYINTIDFESTSPDVAIGASRSGSAPRIGGIRDLITYDNILDSQEIDYLYLTETPHTSIYTSIQHAYPLNQVPYESGGFYYMKDMAEMYNATTINSDVRLIGWTVDELGLGVGGLPSSTSYRDWHTKLNYIPTEDYSKGLNFDRAKQQSLQITGLEVFDNTEGYTFLIGVEKTGIDTGTQQSIFSCLADEGFTTWYDIFRRGGGNDNEYQFASPSGVSTNQLSSSNLTNPIDVLNRNFLSYYTSDLGYVNPYSNTRINKIRDVNCQQDYTNGFFQGGFGVLSKGFDELTNPDFRIGSRKNTNYFSGKVSFLTIIKGDVTKEEEKKMFNNNLFRSPYEVLTDTSKIILDVDFRNPFVDGLDIKFLDNSGNCQIVALGTDWNTLIGVQNSID